MKLDPAGHRTSGLTRPRGPGVSTPTVETVADVASSVTALQITPSRKFDAREDLGRSVVEIQCLDSPEVEIRAL